MTKNINYDLPHKFNYSRGANAVAFHDTITGFTYYFSYDTLVGFKHTFTNDCAGGAIVRKNIWGVTTAKHLRSIDGGSAEAEFERLDEKQFIEALEKMQIKQKQTVIKVNKMLEEMQDKEMRNKALADRIRLNNGYSKAGH